MAGAVRRYAVARWDSAARGLAIAGLLLGIVPGGAASASHFGGTEELRAEGGAAVAVAFSQRAFPDGADEALLGRDDVFADSLASGAMQATRPLLLTRGDSLDPEADAELQRLGVTTVHILGGAGAISDAVEQQLRTAGYEVVRHSGATRLETAVAVATAAAPEATSVLLSRAFPAGEDQTQAFADALAAGAWAAADGMPIVLTETDKLSDTTAAYLTEAGITEVTVVGGEAAVSAATVAQVEALGATVTRVSGATRFATAVAIAAARGFADAGEAERVILLDGQAEDAWVSGFTAAALAAQDGGWPLLLSNGPQLPPATASYLAEGADDVALLCAPSATTDACDAAAEALGKSTNATVRLDETEVAQFSRLTGTATPADKVATLIADGCGTTEEAVLVEPDGTFEVRISAPEGTCVIAFTVTPPEGPTSTQEFELTVTEALAATSAPELRAAEVVESTATSAKVRFLFTEPVNGSVYLDPDGPTRTDGTGSEEPKLDGSAFVLHGPRVALDDSDLAIGRNPKRDFDNPRAVVVEFDRAAFDRATTAAVSDDGSPNGYAAEDVPETGSGLPNVPGSVPLKTATFPGARTESAIDLVGVGGLTTSGTPTGKFRATFTFEAPNEDPENATLYRIVLRDGTVVPGDSTVGVQPDGVRHVVTFDPSKAERPDGTECTGSACPSVQESLSGARRGFLEAAGDRPLQAAPINVEGITDTPDLLSASVSVTGQYVDYVFDQDLSRTGFTAEGFRVYTIEGDVLTGEEATRVESDTVRVTFGDDAVSKLIVGATVLSDSLSSAGGDNAADAVGIDQEFDAGEVLGPKLVDASTVFIDVNDDERTYQVDVRFDRPVDVIGGSLRVYTRNGEPHPPDGCDLEDDRLTCEVTVEHVDDDSLPGLVTVDWATVEAVTSLSGTQYPNVEGSIHL